MAERFTDQVSIQRQDLGTGAAQGLSPIIRRLEAFSESTDLLTRKIGARRGANQAAEVKQETVDIDGQKVAAAPQFRKRTIGDALLFGGQEAAAYNKAIESGYLSALENDLREGIAKIELENRDDLISYNEKVAGFTKGVLGEVDPSSLAIVEQALDGMVTNGRIRVQERTLNNARADANSSRLTAIEGASVAASTAARNGNKLEAAEAVLLAFEKIDNMVSTGDMPVEEAARIRRGLEREVTEQTFQGELLDLADAEGVEAAVSRISELQEEVPGGFTPDEWDAFISSAQSNVIQAEKRRAFEGQAVQDQRDRRASDLEISVSRGTKSHSDIETSFEAGDINAEKRTRLTKLADSVQRQGQEQINMIQLLQSGMTLDPKNSDHRKAIDFGYELMVQNMADAGATPDEIRGQTLRYAGQYGRLPSPTISMVRGGLRSNDPEQMLNSARFVSESRSVNPRLLDDIAEQDLYAANYIMAQNSYGVDPADLPENFKQFISTPESVRDIRGTEYIEISKDETAESWLSNETIEGFELFDKQHLTSAEREQFDGAAELPALMVHEFDQVVRENYQRSGDINSSRLAGIDAVRRKWSVSRVGRDGAAVMMKDAPELHYGVPTMTQEQNGEWIREQLISEISTNAFVEEGFEDRIIVTVDPTRTAPDGRPVYNYIVLATTGQLFRPAVERVFIPDWQSSPEAKRRAEELEAEVAEAEAEFMDGLK